MVVSVDLIIAQSYQVRGCVVALIFLTNATNVVINTLIPLRPAPRTDCAVLKRPNILPPLK